MTPTTTTTSNESAPRTCNAASGASDDATLRIAARRIALLELTKRHRGLGVDGHGDLAPSSLRSRPPPTAAMRLAYGKLVVKLKRRKETRQRGVDLLRVSEKRQQ